MKTTLRQMPLLAPSICYVVGILLGFHLSKLSYFLVFVIVSTLLLIFIFKNSQILKSYTLIVSFIFLGISNHYLFTNNSQCHSCELIINKKIQLHAKLDSEPEINTSQGSTQFIIKSTRLGNIRLQSNFKGFIPDTLLIGDHISVVGKLKSINSPNSPRQFDYKQYLMHKGIYYLFEVDKIEKKNSFTYSLRRSAQQVKIVCNRIIDDYIKNEATKQICLAMVLGEKKSMDEELVKSFRETGTSHYMAVSGLHVDLFALLLLFVFSLVKCQRLGFKVVKYICYVSFIWSYALLVGLSPSVMRAATMFTFYSYGRIFLLPKNTWNILALTALILLIYKPSFLFDVGFQLSFIAVISIVLYSPLLLKRLRVRGKILNKCLSAIKVTLAVQVLIFPLNLYYFHQFPLNFILANSFFWLFALTLIYGSIFLILISFFSSTIATLTGDILGGIGNILQYSLGVIQKFDSFILQDVWLTKTDLFFMYMSIACLTWCAFRLSKISIFFLLISIAFLAEIYIIHINRFESIALVYVYRTYPSYRLDLIYKDNCYTYSPQNEKLNRAVENNRSYHSVKNVYDIDGFSCLEDEYLWNYKNAIGFFGLNILVGDLDLISNHCQYDIIIGNYSGDIIECIDSSFYIDTAYTNKREHPNIHQLTNHGTFIKEIKLQ